MRSNTGKTRIGLVDNHKHFRDTVESVIVQQSTKYSVTTKVLNGSELILELVKMEPANHPSIILLDINMPNMNGFETAKWLRDHYPSIKVLVLSMNTEETDIIKMFALGAVGYLNKNMDGVELITALDAVCKDGVYYNNYANPKVLYTWSKENPHRIVWNSLSEKERKFVNLCCTELKNWEIAKEMNIVPATLVSIQAKVCGKFGVKGRISLVLLALKNKLVER